MKKTLEKGMAKCSDLCSSGFPQIQVNVSMKLALIAFHCFTKQYKQFNPNSQFRYAQVIEVEFGFFCRSKAREASWL